MRFLPKLTGTTKTTTATGRTAKERGRRAKEIRSIEKGTSRWLTAGGWASRNGR